MSKNINWFTVAAVTVGLSMAGNAFATNGYFTHGNGTKNKAMAGSGIALPEDAIDVTNNPAVAPFVGDQLIVGAALFSPIRKYQTTDSLANGQGGAFTIGPNRIESDSNYHVIPHIAKTWQRDNGTAWALSFYGRGGMNTEWSGNQTAMFDPTGQAGAHRSQPRQRSSLIATCGRASMLSGLWHQRQRSGHPFRNTVVRIPGPSSVERRCKCK